MLQQKSWNQRKQPLQLNVDINSRVTRNQSKENDESQRELQTSGSQYPGKTIVRDINIITMLAKFATYANFGYCRKNNAIGKLVPGKNVVADAFVDSSNKEIVVYFKGAPFTSIDRDQKAIPLTVSFEDVDRILDYYVNGAVEKMWPKILEKVLRLLKSFKRSNIVLPIRFTGHGIGGSYAVLAAIKFEKELRKRDTSFPASNLFVEAITFGQPRMGNLIFAKFVNKILNVYRVTHANDPIPRVSSPIDWRHHQREYWLAKFDCNCPQYNDDETVPEILNGHILWECPELEAQGNFESEHPECNAGQVAGTEEKSLLEHRGTYFGVTMGDCL
ncbi:hypothetical protein G9A89_006760 [Geosiphon pyriformis]|nr:hypothetical protein G9A89_006760 [Geosiphon pyriformis]